MTLKEKAEYYVNSLLMSKEAYPEYDNSDIAEAFLAGACYIVELCGGMYLNDIDTVVADPTKLAMVVQDTKSSNLSERTETALESTQ
jgi:hypothetical protein